MYYRSISLFIGFMIMQTHIISAQPWSAQVQSLIDRMTIEEKVGQMTQLSVDLIFEGDPYAIQIPYEFSEEKLQKAIVEYGVGSILNTPTGHYPTVEQWHEIIGKIQGKALETRLKIPVLYGLDHIHGVSYIQGGTLFPQPLAQACSWNPELTVEMSRITAYESRAAGVPWSFSPAMDICRNPTWPRLWESFGEDVLINSIFGRAMQEGFQGKAMNSKTSIAGCLKHFTGYGMPLSGKDRTPAWIPERYLREYYLPQYADAIDEGALTIMINSGEINGIPTHADRKILTDILREEMGFKGFVVSDWSDIIYLHDRHKIAPTMKDAVRIAVEAGIDMSMTPVSYEFADLLVQLVKEGTIPESRIDLSVGRILHVKEKLGLFETTHHNLDDFQKFGDEKHQAVSLQAATESLVMLKNENNHLPLSKDAKVLVVGPTAHSQRSLNGGWSTTWQGEGADDYLSEFSTILEGIRNVIGDEQVSYVEGASIEALTSVDEAVSAAEQVDQVVLCLGELSYTEDAGNLNDLNLPYAQVELAKRLARVGKPITLIITEGRPRIIREVVPLAKGILCGFYPGPQGGQAIANIIFGESNPSGKLGITYPQYANSYTPYDHKYTEDRDVMSSGLSFNPQFEFGHGLSYTTFKYDHLKINKTELSPWDSLTLQVDVSNTGDKKGQEVVMVFVSDLYASITPPVKRLRTFDKILLEPGQSKTLSFKVAMKDLAFVGQDNKWVVEPGEFEVRVGGLSKRFTVQ